MTRPATAAAAAATTAAAAARCHARRRRRHRRQTALALVGPAAAAAPVAAAAAASGRSAERAARRRPLAAVALTWPCVQGRPAHKHSPQRPAPWRHAPQLASARTRAPCWRHACAGPPFDSTRQRGDPRTCQPATTTLAGGATRDAHQVSMGSPPMCAPGVPARMRCPPGTPAPGLPGRGVGGPQPLSLPPLPLWPARPRTQPSRGSRRRAGMPRQQCPSSPPLLIGPWAVLSPAAPSPGRVPLPCGGNAAAPPDCARCTTLPGQPACFSAPEALKMMQCSDHCPLRSIPTTLGGQWQIIRPAR